MDKQYEKTVWFYSIQFFIYLMCFVIPMTYYLVYPGIEHTYKVYLCFFSAAIVSGFLFVNELMQMKSEGWEYFKQFWNLVDMCCFASFGLLFARLFLITNETYKSPNIDLFLNCFLAF